MWPWEHLAVGYILYSGYSRVRYGDSPDGTAAVVAVVASQLPDLIDKPLAWGLSVLPGGRTLGHSLVFAVPVLLVFWALARRADRPDLASAASIPYLAHLVGDVVYPALLPGESATLGFLLWPFTGGSGSSGVGFLDHLTELLANFGTYATSAAGVAYLVFDVVLVGGFVFLWLLDGLPGVAWLFPGHAPGRNRSWR
ncbi:metal-dependent hydrolase [Halobacterium zhouii]|uniref:metal-dependent hydrolase n=1 Tax=Halobacterium zhouii TaxID=2902624 RepID=UPI001E4B66D7|nr:metal-dependent hydrolase [Halobacterium zhouii]